MDDDQGSYHTGTAAVYRRIYSMLPTSHEQNAPLAKDAENERISADLLSAVKSTRVVSCRISRNSPKIGEGFYFRNLFSISKPHTASGFTPMCGYELRPHFLIRNGTGPPNFKKLIWCNWLVTHTNRPFSLS